MTRHLYLSTILLIANCAPTSLFADTRNNGGDVVVCRDSATSKFHGSYLLDYIVGAANSPGGESELIDDSSEVSTFFTINFPELGAELSQFIADAENQIGQAPNWSARYIWREARLGLNDLKDEVLVMPLPENCYESNGPDRFARLYQVVVRQEMPDARSVVMNYSPDIYSKIADNGMQRSFLLIHEWLWNHADNADVVRNINWYLHSKKIQTQTRSDIAYTLANMGFRFSNTNVPGRTVTAKITYTGTPEPNGKPRFEVPEFIYLGSESTEILFLNYGATRFRLRFLDSGQDLCVFQGECLISLSKFSRFPATLLIERYILNDPVWDSKILTLVR
ncbi:MAG: hypothetical protein NTV34_10175 [Proteobacteria bacterium]|nr:hypothetical protein [Pseudomonadota bacterium]